MNWRRGLCHSLPKTVSESTSLVAEPIQRLMHERSPRLNAPPNLCRKFIETLRSEYTGSAVVRCGKHRCYGEMEARLKGDSLINDSKTSIELFKLKAHKGKATVYRDVVGLII